MSYVALVTFDIKNNILIFWLKSEYPPSNVVTNPFVGLEAP
jgi:hypothetical protein